MPGRNLADILLRTSVGVAGGVLKRIPVEIPEIIFDSGEILERIFESNSRGSNGEIYGRILRCISGGLSGQVSERIF